MNKIIKYSELYFTQYSAYTKFSVQNYTLHFKGRKGAVTKQPLNTRKAVS